MINRLLSIIVSIVIGSVALYAQSIDEIRKSAEAGDAVAQTAYAYALYLGKNIPQNTTEAVKWFRKAAEQGNPYAQYCLGICYLNGEGVTQDNSEAFKWQLKAAKQGLADAQFNVGQYYNLGIGVAVDKTEAFNGGREQPSKDTPTLRTISATATLTGKVLQKITPRL